MGGCCRGQQNIRTYYIIFEIKLHVKQKIINNFPITTPSFATFINEMTDFDDLNPNELMVTLS